MQHSSHRQCTRNVAATGNSHSIAVKSPEGMSEAVEDSSEGATAIGGLRDAAVGGPTCAAALTGLHGMATPDAVTEALGTEEPGTSDVRARG
jgi:hypothetical protein